MSMHLCAFTVFVYFYGSHVCEFMIGSLAAEIPLGRDATAWHRLSLPADTYRVVVYSGGVHRRHSAPDTKISFGLSVATSDQSATWRERPLRYADYECATTDHLYAVAKAEGIKMSTLG